MPRGELFYRYSARTVPAIIGLLCIFASHAIFAESNNAGDDAQRLRTPALYAGARSVSVDHAKSKSRKSARKKRSTARSHTKVSKKESVAEASHKRRRTKVHKSAHRAMVGIFTAYTARPKEGVGKGRITADQTNLKETPSCVVANNRLRLGTKIVVEEIGTCEVHDRIGKRVRANRFDIFMNDPPQCAKDFGRRRLKYHIERG